MLLSAYVCEPGTGSETGAGWTWTRAAALHNDVWVLTRENNRLSIEEALYIDPHLRLHPIYLDLPPWARWWKGGGRGARTYYVLWQVLAGKVARELHREHCFDVAHHLTFAYRLHARGSSWHPRASFRVGTCRGCCPLPLGTSSLARRTRNDHRDSAVRGVGAGPPHLWSICCKTRNSRSRGKTRRSAGR